MAARTRLALAFALAALATMILPAAVGAATRYPTAVQGHEAAEAPPAAEATVQLVAFQVVPDRLEITTGTTVTWINNEAADYPGMSGIHELVADDGSWRSPRIAPGTRWSRRFDQPVTVAYRSEGHSTTTGELVVTGDPIANRPVEQEVAITEPNPDDPTTWGFSPADVVIEPGTTVIWRNNGKSIHTVTADDRSFDSGDIAPGATWKHTFDAPGAFAYKCTPHPWMKGSLRIVAPGAQAPPAPVPASEHGGGHGASAAPRTAAPERVGRGPVRHEVSIIEPDPAKPFEWTFDPATLDLKVGDTVAWRNAGSVDHTVTADAFDSGTLAPGAVWERTFDSAGVFNYRCTPHPWMKAVVRVTELDTETLPRLQVAAGSAAGAGAGAAPRAAAATRSGDEPVRHEALIIEPDLEKALEWRFDPVTLEARVGDTVAWRNAGTFPHTVTAESGAFDSGMLDPGKTFERRFDSAGVYNYKCTPHPWMKAVVRVTDASGAEPPVLAAAAPPGGDGEAIGGSKTAAGKTRSAGMPPQRRYRPSLILPMWLGAGFGIVALTVFFSGRPWRRSPAAQPA